VDLRLLPQQQLKVTPKQIAANYILQLSSMELQDVINQELSENPALDLEETHVCPLCGEPLQGRICLNCFGLANKAPRSDEPEAEPLEGASLMQRDEDDEEFDPIVRAEAEQTLAEYLSWNVRVMLPSRLHHVAEYLIGNINDNGRLEGITLEDAAKTTNIPLSDVERVHRIILSIEPWGVGARDTRECLLVQMEHLDEIGEPVPPHAKQIVSEQFRALGEHKFGDIAQALRITREEVHAAWDYIKDSLNPYPAHGFAAGPDGTSVGGREVGLRPDVIIFKDESGEFKVEVIESRRFSLRVNPVYRQLVAQVHAARREGGTEALPMSDQDRQHIRDYVTRAKFFIDNINQRRQTILRITEVIVECQRDFLESGVQSLRPLTRAEVGERIGMHESTVSRATAGKFVLIPNGQVVPFATFFTASLGVKDVIKQIIENEDRTRPYSDQEIVEKLRADSGIILARRTVAKYREELQILPARLRKHS
jgi:RNA polymerase sigma-54 factor